jgi:hypothetical protein
MVVGQLEIDLDEGSASSSAATPIRFRALDVLDRHQRMERSLPGEVSAA